MNHVRSTNAAKAGSPWFREHGGGVQVPPYFTQGTEAALDHGIRGAVQPMTTAAEG